MLRVAGASVYRCRAWTTRTNCSHLSSCAGKACFLVISFFTRAVSFLPVGMLILLASRIPRHGLMVITKSSFVPKYLYIFMAHWIIKGELIDFREAILKLVLIHWLMGCKAFYFYSSQQFCSSYSSYRLIDIFAAKQWEII